MATCAYELARALSQEPGVEVLVMAPLHTEGEAFDRHGFFETRRQPLPSTAGRAVVPMARWLRRETQAWKPDALIALLWLPEGMAMALNRRLAPRDAPPHFIMAHGVEMMETRRNLKKRLRAMMSPLKKRVFQGAAGVLAVSRYTAGLVTREARVAEERVHVVFNGVDTTLFTPGPAPSGLAASYDIMDRKRFLTVTRLEDYKGVDRAIRALRYVVARHPEAVYLVCGTGWDRARLEAMVRRHGLESSVIFAGKVPADRLVDHYRLADCFVLLSREDLLTPNVEGFGLVFLEAAACGIPSIAGCSGGIPDAVAEDETAWMVDPDDEPGIARAMLEVLEKPQLAAARGRAARDRAVRGFTWGHMARRVLAQVERHVRS